MKKFFLIFPALIGIFATSDAEAHNNNHRNDKDHQYKMIDNKTFHNDKINRNNKKNNNYEKYWVQYSDNNSLFFRYLTTVLNDKCPFVFIDKEKIQTIERIHPLIENFPMKICQAEIDNNQNHNIKFKDLDVSTKISSINKIDIIGDTGCITDKHIEQKCNVLSEYPFSEIAKNIASSDSDLIVHVGDYFYSKSKCMKLKECFGRSYGDKLNTWKVDFLNDAEIFLKKTPVLFTRGNHEKCSRGGDGWSVILDSSKEFRECSTYSAPYSIEFEKLRFLVIDSAEAEDSSVKFKKIHKAERHNQLNSYISQFNELAKYVKNDKENILVIHRPVLSKEVRPWDKEIKTHDINYVLNYAIQHSNFKKVFPQIKMILSGHTHSGMFFELQNKNHHVYQIVSGNGGAFLNKTSMVMNNKKVFDYKIKDHEQYKGFGFSELFLKNDKFAEIKFYDYNNNIKLKKVINE